MGGSQGADYRLPFLTWAEEGVQSACPYLHLHSSLDASAYRDGPRGRPGCHRTSVLQQVRTTLLGLFETVGGNSRQPSNSSVDNCRRTRFNNCSGCLIEGGKEGIACLQGIPNCSTFSQSIHRGEHGTSASCGRQAGKGHSRQSLRCRVRVVLPARLDGRLSFQPQSRSSNDAHRSSALPANTRASRLETRDSRLESRQTTPTDATAASSEDALSQCLASFTPSTRVCYSRQGSSTQVKRALWAASSSLAGGRLVETNEVPGARPSVRGNPVLQRLGAALAASHSGRYLPAWKRSSPGTEGARLPGSRAPLRRGLKEGPRGGGGGGRHARLS